MENRTIKIDSPKEGELQKQLEAKNDTNSLRLKRFLAMPDLSRTPGSPIYELAQRIVDLPDFKEFKVVQFPEIVPVDKSFDLFNFPPDHPARNASDTYFVNKEYILRPHTTIMWYYYLITEEAQKLIKDHQPIELLSYGKVYRRDEIDRNHMNVFHQMDGLYIIPKDQKIIGIKELEEALISIAQTIYGKNIEYRFNKDQFPYTDPSIEMEIKLRDKWIEVLGSGIVHNSVLDNLGIDSKLYNGWAFGFGLERLAILSMELPDIRLLWSQDKRIKSQLKLGNKYQEVSKYPPITRDVSFVVNRDFVPNNFFDLIRDIGGDIVEEVELIDKYKDEKKFGTDRISYTYRITYRSNERTLTNEEVDPLQKKVYEKTADEFKAEMR
ncbi:MAG: hypothetical protein ABH833_00200 [Parcubacteria group bacterium]